VQQLTDVEQERTTLLVCRNWPFICRHLTVNQKPQEVNFMNTKRALISAISSVILCTFMAANADAGQLLKCEKRVKKSLTRSKISVEVEDQVPGALYTAMVTSGANTAQSTLAADSLGVAEYDFDSNKKDIAAGATAIPSTFITGNVSVKVTDALGAVVAEDTVACRVR